MTARRFFALVAESPSALAAWERGLCPEAAHVDAFERHIVGERSIVFAAPGLAMRLGPNGLLIGEVFARGSAAPISAVGDEERKAFFDSRGTALADRFWGSFVAILAPSPCGIAIVRSPLGDLPCYFARSAFGLVLASDVALLTRFSSFAPRIDRAALAQHLAAADLRRPATCLDGLDELMGGERLDCDAGASATETVWDPWSWTSARRRITGRDEAAACVGAAVKLAVRARAAAHRGILLRLSGGLDSSIVAACLAEAGHCFVGVTLATSDRGGDERAHARAVARHLGVGLIEARREVGLVDLTRSEAAGLPRPVAHSFAQATSRICDRIAAMRSIDAVFDGGGGDNLFASLQSTAPVADCLHPGGGIGHFWRTARSIGIAARTGTAAVARRTLVRWLTRRAGYRWPLELRFMTSEAIDLAASAADHPWLAPPGGALPGSAAHLALIAAAQSVVHSPDPRRAPPHISPLIAQPVAEACLRVPGWLWTRDGCNRAIAREAFRGLLPAAIIARRDKGAMDSFLFELIERNLGLVRAMLLDGELVALGLIDRSAVETALVPASFVKGHDYMRLMQLVDVEAWLASWR